VKSLTLERLDVMQTEDGNTRVLIRMTMDLKREPSRVGTSALKKLSYHRLNPRHPSILFEW
jgi:hypothetical protein